MWQTTDPTGCYHADLIPIHPIPSNFVGKESPLITSLAGSIPSPQQLPPGTTSLPRMLSIPPAGMDGSGLVMVPYPLPSTVPLVVQPSLSQPPMKVNWATTQGSRRDTTHHHHVFVGDLVPEMKTAELKALFEKYGCVTDARVVRDPETGKSRCYGFVSFEREEDASLAIKEMNGAILPQYPGMKAIRTGWATRKPSSQRQPQQLEAKNYEKVLNETSGNNCTVYIGGLQFKFTEELLRKVFGVFGTIQEVRTFPEKAYAFVRFSNHESATNAIVSVHGSQIEGHVVKCSWGKESSETSGGYQQAQTQQFQFQQSMGQYYQQQPQQQYNQFNQYTTTPYQYQQVGQQQYVVPQGQQYGYYQNPGVMMQGSYVGGYNGGGSHMGAQTSYMMQQGAAAGNVYPNSTHGGGGGYIQQGFQ